MLILSTERILLRTWQESDLLPFAQMNADKEVMAYFPDTLTAQETATLVERIKTHIQLNGFGLWAAELKETKAFIGFIGLSLPTFSAHFTPCVEIGWRLARPYWGQGLATEGAKAVLAYGFNHWKLEEIVSFTTMNNQRSRRVMKKIGLIHYTEDDFVHPNLALDHPFSRHVLYRLSHKQWQQSTG